MRSRGEVIACRHHVHGDLMEAGHGSHPQSKLEGSKGKGLERDGAEGDRGIEGRGKTSKGSIYETAGQLDPVEQYPRKIPQLEVHLK